MRKFVQYAVKIMILVVILIICGLIFWACSGEKKPEKTADVDYQIISDQEVPEEMRKLIEERKEKEFRLSFSDANNMYLAVGYGRQETGGYSISVKEIYQAGELLYIDTELHGPMPEETDDTADSTCSPWIVVKLPLNDLTVYFT